MKETNFTLEGRERNRIEKARTRRTEIWFAIAVVVALIWITTAT